MIWVTLKPSPERVDAADFFGDEGGELEVEVLLGGAFEASGSEPPVELVLEADCWEPRGSAVGDDDDGAAGLEVWAPSSVSLGVNNAAHLPFGSFFGVGI